MLEKLVANYAVININTATLITDGKATNSVYPFNDLESVLDFMVKVLGPFEQFELQGYLANKYYMLVDNDCNKYTFDVVQHNLVIRHNGKPIANKFLKGVSNENRFNRLN